MDMNEEIRIKIKNKLSNYKCRPVTFTKNNFIVVDSNNSDKITKERIVAILYN